MEDSVIKDKAIFIVGLLAVFLALNTFKENLTHILVPLPDRMYSIWDIVLLLIVFLILSGYLYALSYIRHSFGKYQNNKMIRGMFRIIIFLANLCYSAALLIPLFVVLGSIILTSPIGVFMKQYMSAVYIFDTIGVIIVIIATVLNAWFMSKKKEKERIFEKMMDEMKYRAQDGGR